MNPFEGQRRLDVRAEQVVWHLVSAGVLGLLLLLLVVAVSLIDGAPGPAAEPEAPARVARPVEGEAPVERSVETSLRHESVRPVSFPVQGELPLDQVRGRSWQGPMMSGAGIGA